LTSATLPILAEMGRADHTTKWFWLLRAVLPAADYPNDLIAPLQGVAHAGTVAIPQ
jgi:hypothetical protein